jgi:hypothetical protein
MPVFLPDVAELLRVDLKGLRWCWRKGHAVLA